MKNQRMNQHLLGKPIIVACNDEKKKSLYEYQPTRLGDVFQKTLKGYQGIILSDKYAKYLKLIEQSR